MAGGFCSVQLLGIGAVLLWLALVVTLALAVRRLWPAWREWSRKIVHIGSGPVVLIAWGFGLSRLIALPAAALVTLLAALNHRHRLLPAIEDVGRRSYGTVAYGASITLLLALLWPQRADAVCAGVLVMAVGDGLAGLLGPLLPSSSWQVLGERRSLLGTGTMAVASFGVLAALATGMPATAPPWPSLMAIALLATALEQIAVGGLDNLTVPLVVAWGWIQIG
ncbi:MAG: dolichol kinase [Synechococcaceae cyanobacterium]|nr:dolichol kinase [Synechococcaceae cyanobacterium]